MTSGRPAGIEPKTAFDYRRYITLVQALAIAEDMERLLNLCEAWGVQVAYTGQNPPWHFDQLGTIRNLAKHAVEYHREEAG